MTCDGALTEGKAFVVCDEGFGWHVLRTVHQLNYDYNITSYRKVQSFYYHENWLIGERFDRWENYK